MDSSLVTKNIRIGAHRTSVRLEPALWNALEEMSRREGIQLNDLCEHVAQNQGDSGGFTSALRVYVFKYYFERLQYVENNLIKEDQRVYAVNKEAKSTKKQA